MVEKNHTELHTIEAEVIEKNIRSNKAFIKSGYQPEYTVLKKRL